MKNLWAPWRMEYILGPKSKECIFCLATDGVGADGLVLGVGRHTVVMMNKYPYNNGHLLISPKRHLPTLEGLNDEELTELMKVVRYSVRVLKEVMNPEGFNVGLNLGEVAGAGIEEHLHFHVVPRWGGDTNFMTVLGDVRVIPEHIRATCAKLKPYFSDLERVE